MKSIALVTCVVLLFCMLFFSLSACWGNNSLEMENEMFNRYFDTDSEQADALLDSILKCAQSQDAQMFRDLFSKETIKSVEDLDSQIQLLFGVCKGERISHQRFGPRAYSKKEGNKYIKVIEASYDVTTTAISYRIAIKCCTIDSENTDNVGLVSIYIIDAKDSDMSFAYWGDGIWKPGITIESDVK